MLQYVYLENVGSTTIKLYLQTLLTGFVLWCTKSISIEKLENRPLARMQNLLSFPNPFSQNWEKGSPSQSLYPKLGIGI
ncbi:hypothetical protein BZZ01_05775 [Nostocales cyanobacterium HT-58-2]|nr:hypothetical protein BZZ01_05775 [Nostocales cyanobacterium HT-58-2]